MKKILLSAAMALMASIGSAQIIVYVEAPSPNEGTYDFTYANGTGWGVADLANPANAVTGNMVFCDDGTSGDSLACSPLINGPTVTGNVAVLYRGSCEFGVKAKNAQDAGAIAVIIINNASGAPVAMGGGVEGPNVTIPVVMISSAAGALLKSEIEAGNTAVFIGSKNGLYMDDLGMNDADVLRAKSFSNHQLLCQNASEFEVEVGTWVRNFGQNNQTGVTLTCMVDLGASNLYNATSAPFDVDSGDSIFVTLPTFSQSSYANGYYDMTYSITMNPLDESTYDNVREADFMISDSLWSYAAIDPVTMEPNTDMTQFNGSTGSLETCIHFWDPNASRVAVKGVNFSNGTSQNPTATSIDGEYIEVMIYEMTDVFVDINDAGLDLNNVGLDDIAAAEYIYSANLQGENIFLPFDTYPVLQDDVRYMFCLNLYSPTIYPGYDGSLDYNWNFETYQQPINMLRIDGGQWYPAGYGTDQSPAMSVSFFDANSIGLVELPNSGLTAYPNPASSIINVPLGKAVSNVNVTILDMNGRVVGAQQMTNCSSMLTVDVTTLPTGIYTLKLTYDDATTDNIRVVVNR
jgi:hypothetical protein